MALLITFLLGLFILIGALITFIFKNSDKFVDFAISLASSVIIMLIFFHLLPEAFEVIKYDGLLKYFIFLILVSFGFILLVVLDKFIPDHEDDPETILDDDKNLKHIGFVSSIALFIHNIVEGMAVYLLASSDIKSAIITSIGIGLHNIPLGIVIASTIYRENNSKVKTLLYIFFIALSTFIGGILLFFTNGSINMEILEMFSINITIGMLLFILFMELLPKLTKTKNQRISVIGFITGIVMLIISLFLE